LSEVHHSCYCCSLLQSVAVEWSASFMFETRLVSVKNVSDFLYEWEHVCVRDISPYIVKYVVTNTSQHYLCTTLLMSLTQTSCLSQHEVCVRDIYIYSNKKFMLEISCLNTSMSVWLSSLISCMNASMSLAWVSAVFHMNESCLSFILSVSLFVYLSVSQFLCLSICLWHEQSIALVWVRTCLSYGWVRSFIWVKSLIWMSHVSHSFCLSVYVSICVSIYLLIWLWHKWSMPLV